MGLSQASSPEQLSKSQSGIAQKKLIVEKLLPLNLGLSQASSPEQLSKSQSGIAQKKLIVEKLLP